METNPRRAPQYAQRQRHLFSFGIQYPFLALIPAGFFSPAPKRHRHLCPQNPRHRCTAGTNPSTLILTAIIATILKILLFDFSLFICTRICTASKLTWAQISSTMHFCLLPLIITPFAAYFEVSFVGFLALALVIIQTSTAIRSATSCSIFQGFFTMLGFIVLTTLLNLFAV